MSIRIKCVNNVSNRPRAGLKEKLKKYCGILLGYIGTCMGVLDEFYLCDK